ncbi:MAG: 4Fe-4S dicluster domain-containing protein [Candidatus Marinimicrobia bacterium]|nr:4Fe-4S dicluster domain-containing protein [Candidatus Neomarinimicrobiota bacterium]MCF7829970.1 4Fe-4S dicluster domain-containing protein [Candidatus Neomarinimicrobiota bacterium]MCF7881876.1 4Fe-4S dicluster domain-containing protein [Candidatus Neomarinimicrobiota bacterium]
MRVLKLPKVNQDEFVLALQEFGEVHIPMAKGKDNYIFGKMEDPQDMAWEYLRTITPPKKYMTPPKETLVSYDTNMGYEEVDPEYPERQILFGVHPCDIHGIKILDMIFDGEYNDTYYYKRRKDVAIIGLSCTPDDKCFCRSMGTDFVETGFDLFLSELEKSYLVAVGSGFGDQIIQHTQDLLRTPTDDDRREYLETRNSRREEFQVELDTSDLPYILDLERESEVWDEIGAQCLVCGSCSMVCPTCYCFNIYDKQNLDGQTGDRMREWDSCLFKNYTRVAGGETFRDTRADRVKNRYLHKQRHFVEEFGRPSCVGCGRCIDACPAGINVVEVFQRLRGVTT